MVTEACGFGGAMGGVEGVWTGRVYPLFELVLHRCDFYC